MNILELLIPISLVLGALALGLFFWAIRTGQYEDVGGAARRIFIDDDDKPL